MNSFRHVLYKFAFWENENVGRVDFIYYVW